MGLFAPAENDIAYLKAGFMGEAGSGKTHTSALLAIGLVQKLRKNKVPGSEKPVYFLDTEQGSTWVRPMFQDAGIELMVAKTRAFKDLCNAVREAEVNGSLLIVDSVTHYWEELQESYKRVRANTLRKQTYELQFSDWGTLKGMWREFTDLFVNSRLHIIMCGRLGYEYEHVENERTGKRQIEKSGVKMSAEKGLGYEPSILVWMERLTDMQSKIVERTAVVMKDRSQRLDGEQFPNPTFDTFVPHIDLLNIGGDHKPIDARSTSEELIPTDDISLADRNSIKRQILIEEMDALLVEHGMGGNSTDARTKRAALVKKHFKATSRKEIEVLMPLFDLQANFDSLHQELTGKPSRYAPEPAPEPIDDEIPHLDKASSDALEKAREKIAADTDIPEHAPVDAVPASEPEPESEPEPAPEKATSEPSAEVEKVPVQKALEDLDAKTIEHDQKRFLDDVLARIKRTRTTSGLEKIRNTYGPDAGELPRDMREKLSNAFVQKRSDLSARADAQRPAA